jgi:hypothetical protein
LQGSSSDVGVVPEAFCGGGGGGSFELDFTRSKPQAYMPYTATPQSNSVRPQPSSNLLNCFCRHTRVVV